MHGEANVPYSFTPELRSMGNHDNSTIEPSFQENWAALVATINEIEEIASEAQWSLQVWNNLNTNKIDKIQVDINATYIFFFSFKLSTFLRELQVCNFFHK